MVSSFNSQRPVQQHQLPLYQSPLEKDVFAFIANNTANWFFTHTQSEFQSRDIMAAFLFEEMMQSSIGDLDLYRSIACIVMRARGARSKQSTEFRLELLRQATSLKDFESFISRVRAVLSEVTFQSGLSDFKNTIEPLKFAFETLDSIEANYSFRDPDVPSKRKKTGYTFKYLKQEVIEQSKFFARNPKQVWSFKDNLFFKRSEIGRRLSIISCLFSEQIGSGESATVYSGSYLTKEMGVAFRTHKYVTDNKDEWNSGISKSYEAYQIFEQYRQTHRTVLPGLSFLPVQKAITTYYALGGQYKILVTEQHQSKLRTYLYEHKPDWMTRFEIIYQCLYAGAFSEILGLYHMDVGTHNFLIDIKSNGHPRVYLMDLSMIDEHNYKTVDMAFVVTDEEERIRAEVNPELWKKSVVFCYGILLFEMLAIINPCLNRFAPREHCESLKNFERIFKNHPLRTSTVKRLYDLFVMMVDRDPFKRPTCQQAFDRFRTIIAKDPYLAAEFSKLGDYSGPWQTKNDATVPQVDREVKGTKDALSLEREVKVLESEIRVDSQNQRQVVHPQSLAPAIPAHSAQEPVVTQNQRQIAYPQSLAPAIPAHSAQAPVVPQNQRQVAHPQSLAPAIPAHSAQAPVVPQNSGQLTQVPIQATVASASNSNQPSLEDLINQLKLDKQSLALSLATQPSNAFMQLPQLSTIQIAGIRSQAQPMLSEPQTTQPSNVAPHTQLSLSQVAGSNQAPTPLQASPPSNEIREQPTRLQHASSIQITGMRTQPHQLQSVPQTTQLTNVDMGRALIISTGRGTRTIQPSNLAMRRAQVPTTGRETQTIQPSNLAMRRAQVTTIGRETQTTQTTNVDMGRAPISAGRGTQTTQTTNVDMGRAPISAGRGTQTIQPSNESMPSLTQVAGRMTQTTHQAHMGPVLSTIRQPTQMARNAQTGQGQQQYISVATRIQAQASTNLHGNVNPALPRASVPDYRLIPLPPLPTETGISPNFGLQGQITLATSGPTHGTQTTQMILPSQYPNTLRSNLETGAALAHRQRVSLPSEEIYEEDGNQSDRGTLGSNSPRSVSSETIIEEESPRSDRATAADIEDYQESIISEF